jgi:nucleotidyltransferase/DNA polymerase involved in DNA repair
MIAAVKINNFYTTCEQQLDPSLSGNPVFIKSANDGWRLGRSDEAKSLDIEIGFQPFLIKKTRHGKRVRLFSFNYNFYESMSQHVMSILRSVVPAIEVHSIDEAFLDLSNQRDIDLAALVNILKEKVATLTGFSITIGIGSNKALAKLANDQPLDEIVTINGEAKRLRLQGHIRSSRSLDELAIFLKDIQQPLAAHAAVCARQLKAEQRVARKVHVYIQTNPFYTKDKQCLAAVTIPLTIATNSSRELIKYTMRALQMIYQPGFKYQKCGVMVVDLVPQENHQLDLFAFQDNENASSFNNTNLRFDSKPVIYGLHR